MAHLNVLDRRLIQLLSKILLLNGPPLHKSFLWALYQTEHFFDMLHLFYIFICFARLTTKSQEILTVSRKDCIYIRVEGEKYSPVLESLHILPQPGSQMSYAHLLLLQRCEVLLRFRSSDPMVVDAACVLHLTPESAHREMIESVMLERTESVFRHWKKCANLSLAVTAPIKDTKILLWRILAEKYSSFIQSSFATLQKTAHIRLLIKTLPRCTGICPGCGAALWCPDPPGVGVYTGCIILGMSPTTGAHWAPWRSRSTSHSLRARNIFACV